MLTAEMVAASIRVHQSRHMKRADYMKCAALRELALALSREMPVLAGKNFLKACGFDPEAY